jgi:hypothetical protein
VLQVPPSEVERWVIDGSFLFPLTTRLEVMNFLTPTLIFRLSTAIRVGLLTGKLAQPAQTLCVSRATARVFPQE